MVKAGKAFKISARVAIQKQRVENYAGYQLRSLIDEG